MARKLFSMLGLKTKSSEIEFEDLFHKYKNYVFSIALRYMSNTQDAEDAVQEAFLRLSKNIHKIDDLDSKKTRGFISIITRNVCFDLLNKNKDEDDIDEIFNIGVDDDFTQDIENRDTLEYYISTLKERYKHVLILSYIHELSDQEIASSLNTSQSNVRKIRSRALEKLKNNEKEIEYE